MQQAFLKNVLTLVSGNAVAMALPIFFYPIVSRMFTPLDFALYGVYVSIFSFLEVASVGRYDFAIVLPLRQRDAVNLISGGFFVSLIYSLFILVLIFLFGKSFSIALKHPQLYGWLYLLPPTLIFVSVSKLGNSWLVREKRFKASAKNRASQKIGELAAQLFFGFLNYGNGLVLGDLAGRLLNAVLSSFQAIKHGVNSRLFSLRVARLNLSRYVEFPRYSIVPSMLNTLGGMLPIFIISSYYSMEISGSYNFSRIILSVPSALIASGISQVLMQQISEAKKKHQPVLKEVLSLVSRLAILSVIGVGVFYFAGEEIFEWVFGAKWRESGEFTRILIFSYAISFIVSPLSMVLVVLDKVKWAGYWQVFYFFVISLFWFLKGLAIQDFIFVLAIVDLIAYILYGVLIYKALVIYEKNLTRVAQ